MEKIELPQKATIHRCILQCTLVLIEPNNPAKLTGQKTEEICVSKAGVGVGWGHIFQAVLRKTRTSVVWDLNSQRNQEGAWTKKPF